MRFPRTLLTTALGGPILIAVMASALAAETASDTPPADPRVLVQCAPGLTGSVAPSRSVMSQLARYVEKAARWPEGNFGAVYAETEKGGLDRLEAQDAAVAIVPLPFFLEHEAKLGLKPLLQVEGESGPSEEWSLIAKKGRVASAASLESWEITGLPGYSPAFVKGPILGRWGSVPPDVTISFSGDALSALRRAASGGKIAVLVNRATAASLGTHPFAKELETLTKSAPLPATLLCTIGDRFKPTETSKLMDALLQMSRSPEGGDILVAMRIRRFVPVDRKSVDAARAAFKAAASPKM